MSTRFVLVSGVPRAGKSSLCDEIERAGLGFTHVPLDRYVRPIPRPLTFLEWLRTPACIAWDHLREHIAILESGRACFTPRPDWDGGWGRWLSDGGPIADGPGRRMEPAEAGYLIPGTHAFAFPAKDGSALRMFVETPDSVVAERLAGEPQPEHRVAEVVRQRLGTNPEVIRNQASLAEVRIDGTARRDDQLAFFREVWSQFIAGGHGRAVTECRASTRA